ncbi:Glucomannan 4-beta-mannosyltransferase 1 [Camellia lanceoleosa]|uniref:Glucomannan 4-beta-mannosyltransferase 1 n=1 Tax=Camellia lanceoleosa TaxID=1840588 RepID=A0ACC0G7N5_9ERIC|nr:Glucomannan 4-beta-mannosyltransferase 1 [Camellia lanceoleosa]
MPSLLSVSYNKQIQDEDSLIWLIVYKLSIGAACGLSWPSDRFIVQVLDDSTNEVIRALVELECRKCVEKGVNVKYETRSNRNGYKAGALHDGLQKQYVQDCEFVAIFDADFQPDEDFLWNTFLIFLRTRVRIVNADECLMTCLQEMSLDYHFSVEQEVGSLTFWRIQAVNDAGGWKDRTTVEDMDLAVRASLKGWKFVFMGDLPVKNELPSTFKAYQYQQHRWSCGPANLFRKMTKEIILCERVSIWKKCHVIYAFFFVRKIAAHWVTFFFYCVIMPASVLVPVHLPKPIAIYIPATITILNALCTPRKHNKAKVQFQRIKETTIKNRRKDPYLGVDNGHAYAALCNLRPVFRKDHFFIYLLLQAGAFIIIGFGYVGAFVSN